MSARYTLRDWFDDLWVGTLVVAGILLGIVALHCFVTWTPFQLNVLRWIRLSMAVGFALSLWSAFRAVTK